MARFNFSNVRSIIASNFANERASYVSAFKQAGFTDITETDKAADVHAKIVENEVDLVISDYKLSDGEICPVTYRARHSMIGNNPFVVVITLLTTSDNEIVNRAINSGTDAILLKPVEPALLLDRIYQLANARKRYVVTHDYIGPDKRKRSEMTPAGTPPPQMDVPNAVRGRGSSKADAKMFQRSVEVANRQLNELKVTQLAQQIDQIANKILPAYEGGSPDESVVQSIRHLLMVAKDMSRRIQGTPYAHAGQLCLTLQHICQNLYASPMEPSDTDINFLPKLISAIRRAFQLDEVAEDDIEALIAEQLAAQFDDI